MSKMLINSYLWQSFSWFAKRSRDLFNPTGTPVNYNIMWTNHPFYCLLNCPLHHHIRCNVDTRSQSSYFTNHILFIFQIQDSKQYLIEVINIRGADWLSGSWRAWYGQLRYVGGATSGYKTRGAESVQDFLDFPMGYCLSENSWIRSSWHLVLIGCYLAIKFSENFLNKYLGP